MKTEKNTFKAVIQGTLDGGIDNVNQAICNNAFQ